MRRCKPLPSLEFLNERFSYNPETGFFCRKSDGYQGYVNCTGYRQIAIGDQIYFVHRLAWKMSYGADPDHEVDHVNGNRSDNSVINLRAASSSQNNQNRRLSSRNKSGVKGVFRVKWNKDVKWRVAVGHNRGEYHIAHFTCFGKAVQHARHTRKTLHANFANNGGAA